MNPRTLVKKTIELDSPPRLPRQVWILPWAEEHHPESVRHLRTAYPDDIVPAPAVYTTPPRVLGERYRRGTYIDEWGCRFDNLHDGVIGITREPLITDWAQLESFSAPPTVLTVDRDAVNAFCRETERFVLAGSYVRPFERLGFIRTLEQALIDLIEQPPELFELLERIHRHYLKEIEAWAATDVDAVALMDDWGTQHGIMIDPELWREIFKPMYRDYAEVARRYGKYVFMHSDGYITEIIPDLIEVGVHALNSQVACMGVAELGARFRGKITFWGEIDRQQLLPFGTPDEVRAAVQEMLTCLDAGGGLIAQCEFGPGAKPENVIEVFRAWDQPVGGGGALER